MLILILETKKGRQKQKVSSKIFAIPVTLSTVACTQAPADMLKITSTWVLPDFCRNYCHPGIVHSHWFQTPFCSCNIWRGWLDSSHWFHVSIGLKNWSLQSSQRHNTWTGIVNRNWLVPSNDGPLLPGVKVVLNICFVLGFFCLPQRKQSWWLWKWNQLHLFLCTPFVLQSWMVFWSSCQPICKRDQAGLVDMYLHVL